MPPEDTADARLVERLVEAMKGIRYGGVQGTIHDGKVVRIERMERIRLTDSSETIHNLSG